MMAHSKRTAIAALVLGGALFAAFPANAQLSSDVADMGRFATLEDVSDHVVNMIMVRVNGDPILLTELRRRVGDQVELMRTNLSEPEIAAQLPALRMNVLVGMIDELMMSHRAERLGIVVGPNEVDRWIASVREQNNMATEAELEAELARVGMTMEDLRAQARTTIEQQRLAYEDVNRSVFVSESDIHEYYEENLDQYQTPEAVRLEQLVFIGDAAQLADQAAAAVAELRGGADLDSVGGNYVDATAMGDTGTFIEIPNLIEELAVAIPDMETGVYSDPIATNFGLSIVKVVERTVPETAELDDVREDIQRRLQAQKSSEALQDYLGELRGETRLEILDPRLMGLDEAWKAVGQGEQEESN